MHGTSNPSLSLSSLRSIVVWQEVVECPHMKKWRHRLPHPRSVKSKCFVGLSWACQCTASEALHAKNNSLSLFYLSLLSLSSISLSFLPLSLVCLLHTQKRLPVSCVDSSCRKHPPFINKIFRSAVMAVKVVSFFFFFSFFTTREEFPLHLSPSLHTENTPSVFHIMNHSRVLLGWKSF